MAGAAETPMMRQYLDLKAQVPDALLLYRMGDFYELFFEDAEVAAATLELTLTSRNKADPDPIPMAGVPYHALDGYLRRLVDAGHKVAIAEQRAAPGSTKILERELVRVVTPGLPWDSAALEGREPCWLAAACAGRDGRMGLAFLDVTTGGLRVTEVEGPHAAAAELSRMDPRELLLPPDLVENEAMERVVQGRALSRAEAGRFDAEAGDRALRGLLGTADLRGFGAEGLGPALGAAGALIAYAREQARVDLSSVRRLVPYAVDRAMVLDESTRRNLEILRPLHGTGRKGTLLGLLDRCNTPMGSRRLRSWLAGPLVEVARIRARQAAVTARCPAAAERGCGPACARWPTSSAWPPASPRAAPTHATWWPCRRPCTPCPASSPICARTPPLPAACRTTRCWMWPKTSTPGCFPSPPPA